MALSLSQQFAAWVRSKPEDELFDPWDGRKCVGFQFMREHGFPINFFGVHHWEDRDGVWHQAPSLISDAVDWATDQTSYAEPQVSFGALASRLAEGEQS